MRPAYGRTQGIMQVAAAVLGAAAAAQPVRHVTIDNGLGEDWMAADTEVSSDGHSLILRDGTAPGGGTFEEARIHLDPGVTWQVGDGA